MIRILLAQAWKKIADLSPAIGLYAALGAEATRPGAITPAEIKSGGPSDSGISLLYKLLQEYQSGQIEGEGGEENAGQSSSGGGGGGGANAAADGSATIATSGDAVGGGSGVRTPALVIWPIATDG